MPGEFCTPSLVCFVSCGVFSPTFVHFPQPGIKQNQYAKDIRLPDTSQHPFSHTLMRITTTPECNEVNEIL